MKADALFAKMRNQKNHFAVVLDEYGGMCGVITITDLVEQLVGTSMWTKRLQIRPNWND